MFGNTRQPNANAAPQSSRTRRQNIRSASPGPSTGAGSGGGGLFAAQVGASGKAPPATYREREHYQAELTQDQKDEIADAVCLPPVVQKEWKEKELTDITVQPL